MNKNLISITRYNRHYIILIMQSEIETNVLIIGSGIAGLRASLEASKYSNNVKIDA